MSSNPNKTALMAASVAGSLLLAGSAFAATPLSQGYMLGAQDAAAGAAATDKAGHEGKCGEGNCGVERVDTDGDGRLSPAEFAAAHDGDGSRFGSYDADGDGFVSTAEMDARHAAKKEAKGDMEGKCGEGKCGSM